MLWLRNKKAFFWYALLTKGPINSKLSHLSKVEIRHTREKKSYFDACSQQKLVNKPANSRMLIRKLPDLNEILNKKKTSRLDPLTKLCGSAHVGDALAHPSSLERSRREGYYPQGQGKIRIGKFIESRKGVHMYKGVGVRFADFIYPMKIK